MYSRPVVPADAADVGVIATVLAMLILQGSVDRETQLNLLATIEKLADQLIEVGVISPNEVGNA